jgi:hypothetical protein
LHSSQLSTVEPRRNVKRLEHLFAVEKGLMRVEGARLPDLESWTLKQKIGYFLYADALHADEIRTRRRELQAGTREFPPLPSVMQNVLEQVLFAEGDYLFCTALYLGFKPLLVQAYRQHLAETTIVSDHPTQELIRKIIAETEQQIAWVEGALSMMPAVTGDQKKTGQEWVARVQGWVQAAGGILGEAAIKAEALPAERSYTVTPKARREPRQHATFAFEQLPGADSDLQAALLTQFGAYFREMAAAETMAALLWEAPQAMPWDFFIDSARHFWDEIRHCQVGQQRLEVLGLDIWQVPVQTGHYDARAHMPLLERYAFLTQVQEAESFSIKRVNERLFREAGDQLSADMVAYDMADERNHVRYGTKWIPVLQKVLGDTRSMEELVTDSRRMQAEIWRRLSGGQEAHPDGQY